jgi:hypothetical protein
VKVVNKDGVSITTKVVTKQLCYMSIFLFKEIAKKMSHLVDGEAWNAIDHLIQNLQRTPRVFILVCRPTVSDPVVPIVIRTLVGEFSSCPTISIQKNV